MTWLKTIKDKTHGIKSACSCGIPNCGCKDTAAKFTSPQGSGAYDAGAAGAGPPAQFKNVTDTEDKGQYAEGAPEFGGLSDLTPIKHTKRDRRGLPVKHSYASHKKGSSEEYIAQLERTKWKRKKGDTNNVYKK